MNRELLKRTRDWVAAGGDDQYKWDQANWLVSGFTCGTACCVAGYAALQSGYIPLDGETAEDPNGNEVDWFTAGETALGLSGWDIAEDLFSGYNTKAAVLALIDDLLARGGGQ